MSIEIDIISCINEKYPQLREAEKKVADVVVNELEFASLASISELAAKAEVSEASVTRFSKALGCRNIRDLKMRIAKTLVTAQQFIYEKPDESGVSGIYESAKNVIQRNRNAISETVLNQVCEIMTNARHIVAVGMGGGSTIMSQELQYRLFRFGLIVTAYNDGLLSRMVASTVEKNDVFFVLSASGSTREVNEAASIAKQYGATVIAITSENSELARISDFILPIINEEGDFIYKPSTSRYAMLVAIDCLAYRLAVMNKPKSRDKLRRIKINLDSHRPAAVRQPLGD
ncbi:MurR/RpiR family transcriptional regulator [Vibrio sinensis]|uniref:MurR/RpiR family transcriptional regulator n=1 Tax=Vibrio sinensis TaxID=2302434 RepID=A0A3A6QXI1_9VIBR|nr:MurR/RpiR family transcriptional regulator [Vibrio sinensis]RJX73694.1 MurR/RpiR family transcriptional regulator [Vibrio sinensis]